MPARYDDVAVRPFGCFGFNPVIGFVEPDPQLCFGGRRILGTTVASHWMYGGCESLDGGRYFTWMKHYTNQGSLGLQIYEAERGGDLRYRKESRGAYLGAASAGPRDGRWGAWDILREPNPRFSVLATPQEAHWIEGSLVDLQGEVLLNSIQVAVPDADWTFVYTSRCMRARGRILDTDVEGFWYMSTVHLPDGQDLLTTPYFDRLQGAWVIFTTEFVDGTIQHGTMFCGREGFQGLAVERTDGETLIVVKPEFEVELDDEEYPIRVTATVDKYEAWEWTRLPSGGGKMPALHVAGSPRWIEGIVRQKGDTREVKRADAYMETYKDRLEHVLVS